MPEIYKLHTSGPAFNSNSWPEIRFSGISTFYFNYSAILRLVEIVVKIRKFQFRLLFDRLSYGSTLRCSLDVFGFNAW
jgi:hypothetical protein